MLTPEGLAARSADRPRPAGGAGENLGSEEFVQAAWHDDSESERKSSEDEMVVDDRSRHAYLNARNLKGANVDIGRNLEAVSWSPSLAKSLIKNI